mmetsp:Transcript_324/g.370  ORF Transcript_324/g.370 Transcript_324/m.370 type:complete len:239 (-) Transcript_324:1602-2318(-)|eukprot:CAMPEP_0204858004 /NCGR_PEP_ID=MMETSP1347-20130617/21701_1 /ASSEMBLY_ACC=CAM_ASM_000690 /TAXON_ID=215587 /ORGANISM="Aplanochytrium stocchinoi, Strain GSBS06" /LENGTH=238 /DNA_ID=CAMNT_0052005791 /DNA_START=35 /DNA_END=751 /DNA_ORIENTATION=+
MEHARAVGGPLVLKGIDLKKSKSLKKKKSKKHKREKKKHKKGHKKRKRSNSHSGGSSSSETESDRGNKEEVEQPKPVRQKGTGRILTSGTTIHGMNGTQLSKELSHGDVILVRHPTSLVEEIRVVTMVLSDVSASLSSAFSSDLSTAVSFEYMKKPKEKVDKTKLKKQKLKDREEEEKAAYGTYATAGRTITYRARKGGTNASGGYHIVTETLKQGKEISREELLDLRCKKKGDRNCY